MNWSKKIELKIIVLSSKCLLLCSGKKGEGANKPFLAPNMIHGLLDVDLWCLLMRPAPEPRTQYWWLDLAISSVTIMGKKILIFILATKTMKDKERERNSECGKTYCSLQMGGRCIQPNLFDPMIVLFAISDYIEINSIVVFQWAFPSQIHFGLIVTGQIDDNRLARSSYIGALGHRFRCIALILPGECFHRYFIFRVWFCRKKNS